MELDEALMILTEIATGDREREAICLVKESVYCLEQETDAYRNLRTGTPMESAIQVKIKKISERAKTPKYAHPGEDACFDLSVLVDDAENEPFRYVTGTKIPLNNDNVEEDADGLMVGVWLRPGDSVVFKTGISFEIPKGFVMKIYDRSSTGIKNHLMLSNGTGIIDSGYRDVIHIALTNFGNESVLVRDGDRVAQAEICKIEPVEFSECDSLSDSERGLCGIGSTGI